jgi:serine/threonine-protein kinase
LTVATGQEETAEASRPVQKLEGQPSEVWGATRIGELVGGKYRISRFLAEGGMGVVYEAQHEIVKRRFAVKFLRPGFAQRREALGRFQREAEAAGGLESEHIASVVDFGIAADGSPYIVMECLLGESLASLLSREGPLPYRRAADLCVQACHGAETAHASGIVHRDLKPQNVFVCRREDGTDLLKILDFGIAKLEPIKHEGVSTQTGAVLGTPAYMSPEQARGERTVDLRTDVYSLGAILFEMLSGELPHPGDSPNAVLYHISSQPAVSLAALVPDLPKLLIEMVDGALASDPGARPRSAKAFAAGVARFAKREVWPEPSSVPTTALPSSDAEKASTVPASLLPGAELGPAKVVVDHGRWWRPGRYPAWARVAVPGLAAAVVAVFVAAVISGRSPRTVPGAIGAPPTARHDKVPANSEAPQQSVEVGAIPKPPLGSVPATSSASDGTVHTPARTLARERERAGGRPLGRPLGRRTGSSGENAPEGKRPGEHPEGSTATKPPFPRATFDPDNPYGSHER